MGNKLLLLDIGNTRSKWTVVKPHLDEDFHTHFGAVNNSDLPFKEPFPHGLEQLGLLKKDLGHIIVCNVAGQLFEDMWMQFLMRHFPNASIQLFTSELSHPQIKNHYQENKDLGNDRWAAIVGGLHFAPEGQYLVVNCGTAMTIDYVDESLDFEGGWIIPGVNLMLQSLGSKTALLPNITLQDHATMTYGKLGSSTQEAILQGVLHAQIGAIEMAIQEHGELHRLILSGGNAGFIGQFLLQSHLHHDQLIQDPYVVFRGLRGWYLSANG